MKLVLRSLLLLSLLLAIIMPLNTVSAVPPIAQSFYGTVTLDGAPAPNGTSVTAEMNGRVAGSDSVSGGEYSLTINTIEGDHDGDTIYFYVAGYSAGSTSFSEGAITQRNLSATSPPEEYTLSISTSGSGSVSGAGTYEEGEVVNISANPADGWEFVNWTGDTGTIANVNSASTTITMNGDYSITANFVQLPQYTLAIYSGSGGSVSGAGTYYEGQVVNIRATADTGWAFDNWSGDTATIADVNDRTTTITMNGDYSITANFSEAEIFTLTMAVNGEGTTTPEVGEHEYTEGSIVNISATPAEGWEFAGWGGGVTSPGSASTTVVMSGDKTVTANFSQIGVTNYTLTVAVNGNGSTTPAAGEYTYAEGTVVNISATPAEGWRFDGWMGGVANPNSASTTVTVDGDKTVTANFSEMPTHTLTIVVDGEGATTPQAGTHTYAEGTVVNISATPAEGWRFDGWTGSVANPNSADTTVTMDSDKTITAGFSQAPFTLTMAVNGSGSTTPAVGEHEYTAGEAVSITATPDEGWQFDGWTGDVANPNSTSTSVKMDADKTVTANFIEEGDTTPPAASHILAADVGETEANVFWLTDEPADSRVEYWASPGQLTPLDTEMVTEHLVHISDLTPGTTYTYKVMSTDASGNQMVSDEYTFTTTGTAAAEFAASDWDLSLGDAADGSRQASVSFVVTNNGSLAGSYQATFTLNGSTEDTREVTLAAGASQTITFTATLDAAGDYEAAVVGEFAFSFSLEPSGGGISWLLIIGIIAGTSLLAALIIWLIRSGWLQQRLSRQIIPTTSRAAAERYYAPAVEEEAPAEEAPPAAPPAMPPQPEEAAAEDSSGEDFHGLTITAMAMLKLREALQSKTSDPEMGFRIVLSDAKPNQLRMILDKQKEGDQVVESEGIKLLFLSPGIIPALEGMVIDYQETPQGSGFTISKPPVKE